MMKKGVYQRVPKPLSERFWKHVEKADGCWVWRGATANFGYGILWSGKPRRTNLVAHRVSWEINCGPIPRGMFVCHKCDNPPCVRPDHLFIGTPADNNRDRDAKGRMVLPPKRPAETYARGEAHHRSVLTTSAVRKIRAAQGKYRDIGKRFGVSNTTVRMIKIGRAWGHVT